MKLLRAIWMMVVQWIDVISGLLLGRMDRWSMWLLLMPVGVVTGIYFGIFTLAEAAIFIVLYTANVAVRRWILRRSQRDRPPDLKAVFE